MRVFTFIVALVTIGSLWAQKFQSDELYYEITDESNKTVQLSKLGNISGILTIPSTVIYENKEYTVTSIGDYAFYDEGYRLTAVTIPEGVKSIGNNAFYFCTGLTSVIIPNGVTDIGGEAFSECHNLTSITIPESVMSIGGGAFIRTALTSITIPKGVTNIGRSMFHGCSKLTSINIPESVTSIGSSAFWGCSSLTSILIPKNVTTIGGHAFEFCSNLTSITLPENITVIEQEVFSGCSSLTSIVIPENVTIIGNHAFQGCTKLTSATFPEKLTRISDNAFSNCSNLTSLTIPQKVTSIGGYAFYDCEQLKEIRVEAINPPIIEINLGISRDDDVLVYVPKESMEIYQTTDGWKDLNLRVLQASGIDDILINQSEKIYYDLQGRRVLHPTKGIYINQYGKKVFLNKK